MKNNLFKKSLSVFMAVLMILSCWVWVPGEHNHASAADAVNGTANLTAMAVIYDGGTGDRAPSGKIVICGDGGADNTTVGVAKFNIASLPTNIATATLNLNIGNHGGSIPSSAKIYLINPNKCTDVTGIGQKLGTISTVYGGSYTGTTGANNAYNYFGIAESQSLGEIWQNQTGAKTFDVTAAVETARTNGWNELCLAFIMPKTYGNNGSPDWSDIHIGTNATVTYTYYNYPITNTTISSIEQLGDEITAYENFLTQSTFYTNMENNYRAYNDAKRYYDAVVYGGVAFDATKASEYYSVLHSHMYQHTGVNDTYVNYLNQTITSRGTGETVGAAYRKNVIWYPWNFSYGFTQDGNWVTKESVRYYWTIPNTVVGILDNDTSTFPFHGFFFSSSNSNGNRGIRSLMVGEKNSDTSVDTSKFYFSGRSKVGSLTHTTSGFAGYGDNSFGDWSYETYSTTDTISNATQNEDDKFVKPASTMYQISNYVSVNNANLGVSASNIHVATPLDLYVTFSGRNLFGNTKTEYVMAVEDHGGFGYAHAVYMQTYKDNYENWKTIIPNLSYKNYNGYAFSYAPSIAEELDSASTISLAHGFTGSDATASHDTFNAKVSTWATNVNVGANHLKTAKTEATSAAKVTNKYVDLTAAIKAADSIYANDQAKYTPATWNAFKTAYEAARAHMAALSPAGTGNQYSTDATAVGNLATALQNAQAALQYVTVTYKYYDGTVAKTISAANGEVLIGTTAPTLASKAPANTANKSADDTNHYTYSWPSFADVTDSATYQETRGTQAHQIGDYIIDQDSTCTSNGSKHKECANCDYKTAAETIPVKAHTPGAAATCTDPQTCTVCGTVLEVAKGHTPGAAATCQAPQTCTVCGVVLAEKLAHTEEIIPAVPATCTTPGKTEGKKCSICGEILVAQQDTELAAHTEEIIPAVPATCTTPGKTEGKKCSICGEILVAQQDTELAAHTEVDVPAVDATCTSTGLTAGKKCSVCGTVTVAQTETPMLAHVMGDWSETKAPTCITAGEKTRKCANCTHTETEAVAATGVHVYGEWSQFNNGLTHRRTCTADVNCTAFEEESHNFNGALRQMVGNNYHQYKCEKCEAYGVGTQMNVGEACFEEGTTFTQIENDANQHKETCKCGREKNDAHTWAGWVADPENKTDENGQMSNTCSECGYKKTTDCTYIATNTQNATCTVDGHKTWECTKCDNGYTEILKAPGHTEGEAQKENVQAATCTADGSYEAVVYCTVCDTELSRKTETVPAAGHDFGEITPADAATCVATGNEAYKQCTVCSKFFAADADVKSEDAKDSADAFTTEIDSTNHENTTNHEQTHETCLNVGYTAGVFCEDCDNWISGHEEIPAIGHKNKEHHVKVDATCISTGTIEYWSCPDCNKNFSDEDCTTEVTELTIAIDADAHKYGDWTETKAPTCSEAGEKQRICEYDATHVDIDTVAIDATAHKYGDWTETKAPTCSEAGEKQRVCEYDAAHVDTEAIAIVPDAHNYSVEITARPELVDGTWTDGTYTYTCKYDESHTKTEAAPRADYSAFDKAVEDLNALLSNEKLTEEGKTSVNGALAKAEALAENLVVSEQPQIGELVTELNRIKAAAEQIIANSGKPQPITEAVSGLKVQFLEADDIAAIESLQLNAGGGFDTARLRLTNNNKDLPITVVRVESDKTATYLDTANTPATNSTGSFVIDIDGSKDLYIAAPASFNETGVITYTVTYNVGSAAEGYLMNADGTPVELQTKAYIYVKGAAFTPYHLMDEKAAWPLTATSKWQHYFEAVNYGDFELISDNSASKFSDNLEVGTSNFGFRHDAYDYAEDGCQAGCENGNYTTGDAHAATYRYYIDTSLAPTWEDAGFRVRITEKAESVYENAPLKYVRLAVDQTYLDGISGDDKTFSTTFVPSASSNVPNKTWTVTSTGTLAVEAYENPDRSEYLFGEHKNKDGFDETSAYVNFSGSIPVGVNDAKMMFSPRIEFNGKSSSESVTMTSHIWIVSYDKGELRAAVNAAEQAAYNRDYYASAEWDAYNTALRNAKEVLGKAETTQSEVNEKLAALNTAVAALTATETRAKYVLTLTDSIHESADRNSEATSTQVSYFLLAKGSDFTPVLDADVIALDTINKYDDAATLTINGTTEHTYNYWYIDYSDIDEALEAAGTILENQNDYSEEFIDKVTEAKEALEEVKNETKTNTPESQATVDEAIKAVTDLTGHTCDEDVVIPAVAPTCTDTGLTAGKKCSVCGKITVEQEVVDELGHDWKATTYSFAADGSTCTATRECQRTDCGVTETATATITSAVKTPATCTVMGWTTYTATFTETWAAVQYKDVQDIAINENNHVGDTYTQDEDIVAGTCISEKTWNEVTYCSDCDAKLGSEAKTGEIDSTNHIHKTNHEQTYPTCLNVGYTTGVFCEDCDKWISGHEVIPATNHENKEHHTKVDATCIAEGTIEYWSCPDCGKNFSDEECTTEAANLTIAIDADNHTKLIKTNAVEETCEDNGNIDYWTCEGCDKIYSDANATTEIKQENTVIAAKGHDYGAWTYDADGNHKRVCANDASHVETEACADSATDNDCNCDKCSNLVAHSYGNATCDAPATCTVCGVTTGGALGHDWDTVTYTWSADNNSCTAERVCKRDPSHKNTATATVSSVVKTDATCTVDGWTTYTATFEETWAAEQKLDVQDIPAINHDWADTTYNFAADGKTCTAERVCKNDANHVEKANATITSAEKTPATCTVMGWTTYTATFTETWADEQTLDVQDIKALDHDWADTTYSFAADGSTCTATRECQRENCDVTETATSTITSKEKIAPTCTVKGTTTYTATFSVDWAAEQSLDVQDIAINASNHVGTTYTQDEDIVAGTCISEKTWNEVTYCSDCDAKLGSEAKTGEIDSNNHINKTNHEETDPTCLNVGYTAGVFCEDCDKWISGHDEIDAIGHKNKVHHTKVDATCMATGTIEYWSCPDCGKNFSDEECTTVVTDLTIEINPDAHSWNDWTQTTAPTCSAAGEDTRTCKHNAEHKETRPVAIVADAHKWETEYTTDIDPECETPGSKSYHCEYCDAINEASKTEIPATDHDYDMTKSESNLTRPALVDGAWTQGYYTYTCKNDANHTTTEKVDRATYTDYEAAKNALEALKNTDLTAEAKEAIQKILDENVIADNLIASEQNTVASATANLKDAFEQYKGSLKTYTVTFVVDGVKTETTVISGNDATAPTDVKKAYDETYHYEFTQWDTDFTNVTSDLTVTAVFTAIEHNYTTHTYKDAAYHTDKCACGYEVDAEHTESTAASCLAPAHCDVCASDYGAALGHKDENKDHACDNGCDVYQGEHKDDDLDHVCDYGCSEAIGDCEDADKDHDCDYGCNKYFGTHADTDLDHVCDYGCAVAFGTCEDADKDHHCDYGCDKYFGTHADTDLDHVCDYGCSEAIGDCEDTDHDHHCDYGCDKYFGTHEDTDYDHVCDYGCSVAIGDCVDADKDHACDYGCDKYFGTHEDANKDHACDYGCADSIGTCVDADKDHACDYGCDKVYGEHEDANKDHACDYGCSEAIGDCVDADKDHACDYGCDKVYGEHEDANKDHACDYGCSVAIGTHADSADDKDHVCDYGCGEILEEHTWGEWKVTKAPTDAEDGTYTRVCTICDATETKSVAREDYSAYDEAIRNAEELLEDETLTADAKKEIQDAIDEAKKLDQNLPADVVEDGKTVIDNDSADKIADAANGLTDVLDKITNDETGAYEKPDYTDAENAITNAENIDTLTDEEKAKLEELKQELEDIRNQTNPSATAKDNQDDVDAIEDAAQAIVNKYADCESGNHSWNAGVLTRPELVDGAWTQGYYTYTCTICGDTKVEYVERADYSEYDAAVKKLEDLLKTDITDEAKATVQKALDDNSINDKLISSEQSTVDEAVEKLEKAFEDNDDLLNTYTVTFIVDGKTVDTETVISGNDATAPTDVKKAYDETYHYEFDKWSTDFTNVTSDLTVTAEFTAIEHNYTTHTYKDADYHTDKCACGYEVDAEHTESTAATCLAPAHCDVCASDYGVALGHKDENKDHACDNGCDVYQGEHEDANKDHACDYGCADSIGTCEDADKDHNCDYGCDKYFGTHEDANKDHVCDYGCAVAFGTCEDADKDHNCDYGCDKVYGEHEDTDLDHVCDYGCSEAIGDCEDTDHDHHCDYGCDKYFGTHADTDYDHVCDYGCSVAIGDCVDADKDHDCDYGCDKNFGTHEDTDYDHVCDYGCSVAIGDCVDADKDHACDYGCDKYFGTHEDANKDHACDYGCSVAFGTCEDADKDHACDYGCDKVYGEHKDDDLDHVCDYGCADSIGTCEDADKDHDCDYGCDKTYGDHVDANFDHACDYGCAETIGTCEDADKDHDCDYGCDKTYGDHVDANLDHACDYGCAETIGTCEDADKDHDCDYGCDKYFGTHEDANKDHACDYGCAEAIGTHADSADDNDHVCDHGCGAVLEDCTWGEWKLTKAPTDAEDGTYTRVCTICDATETKSVARENYSTYDEAIKNAEELLEDETLTADAKKEIQDAIDEAKKLDQNLPADVVEDGKTVIDNDSAEKIADAAKDLTDVLDKITNDETGAYEKPDYEAWEEAETAYDALDKTNVKSEIITEAEALKTVIAEKKADDTLTQATATQAQINEATARLDAIIKGIEDGSLIKDADFTDADADLADAKNKAVNNDVIDGVKDDIDAIEDALDNLKNDPTTNANDQATIDALEKELEDIIAGIENGTLVKPDFTDADKDLADAKNKAENNDVINGVKDAIEDIEEALNEIRNDGTATKADDQDDVAALEKELEDIIAGIEDGTLVKPDFTDADKDLADAKDKAENNDVINGVKDAIEDIEEALNEIRNDGTATKADDQDDVAALEKELEDIIAGIEDGTFVKPDYTDAETAIENAENAGSLTDADKAALEEIKAALEEIKNDPTSNKKDDQPAVEDIKEAVQEILDKYADCENGNHNWGAPVLTTAPTADTQGEYTEICGTCGATQVTKVDLADYDEFNDAVDALEDLLDTENLTEETKAAIEEALTKAEALDKNLPADVTTAGGKDIEGGQDKIDALVTELNGVIADITDAITNGSAIYVDYDAFEKARLEYYNNTKGVATSEDKRAAAVAIGSIADLDEKSTKTGDNQQRIDEATAALEAINAKYANCAADNHNYESHVTAPTCTNKGYTTYTCTVCGDSYKDNYVDKTAHNYTSRVTAPTCTQKGYTTYLCVDCGHSYDGDYVAALGHTEIILEAVEATCSSTGLTEGSMCATCNQIVVPQKEIPKLKHTDADNDGICDSCGASGLYDGCSCLCHNTHWFWHLVYIIIRIIWRVFNIHKECMCGAVHF